MKRFVLHTEAIGEEIAGTLGSCHGDLMHGRGVALLLSLMQK